MYSPLVKNISWLFKCAINMRSSKFVSNQYQPILCLICCYFSLEIYFITIDAFIGEQIHIFDRNGMSVMFPLVLTCSVLVLLAFPQLLNGPLSLLQDRTELLTILFTISVSITSCLIYIIRTTSEKTSLNETGLFLMFLPIFLKVSLQFKDHYHFLPFIVWIVCFGCILLSSKHDALSPVATGAGMSLVTLLYLPNQTHRDEVDKAVMTEANATNKDEHRALISNLAHDLRTVRFTHK